MPALYDSIGTGYNATRRADCRIVDCIVELLDLAPGRRVLDVGAGTGSYSLALAERGYEMVALEPSSVMRDQAQAGVPVTWVEGTAESLPFPDGSFDGAILILCIHHFADKPAAFAEVRRVVSSGPIVIFTYDPDAIDSPWLFHYFPAFRTQIRGAFPTLSTLGEAFRCTDSISARPFPLPHDLVDGFAGAAWRYPERYLERDFREGTSAFRQTDPSLCEEGLATLERDLESGAWDVRFGAIRSLQEYGHGYTFVTIKPPKSVVGGHSAALPAPFCFARKDNGSNR
ncbi:MAG: class I SAM-dependent methyltransferase [Opitutales bacterium]|nr:class I SAM-dependent methyltransferase [Opitutales bacterium]